MLDRLAPLAHGLRVRLETLLYGLDDVLMLPSRDPALLARGALVLDRAGSARVGPIATQLLSVLRGSEVVLEVLASRAAVDILLGQIDEVLLAEAAFAFAPDRNGLGSVTVMPACSHARISSPLK